MKNFGWIKIDARKPNGWQRMPEVPPGIVVGSFIIFVLLIVLGFIFGGSK